MYNAVVQGDGSIQCELFDIIKDQCVDAAENTVSYRKRVSLCFICAIYVV